jgi:DNA polymerase delta subunit 1
MPKYISKAKGVLESGSFSMRGYPSLALAPFESNISYVLRFMIDHKVTGANWIELPAGKWRRRYDKVSTAQIEVDILASDLISHAPDGEWSKIAPLRILSFDIECAGRKGIFPDANVDSVIQIANMVTVQGESKPFIRNIFTFKDCGHIVGSHIMSFDEEAQLLQAWSDFFREVDPDIITGYNINNFDWPYLIDRAEKLKVTGFSYFGRVAGHKTQAKDTRFSSKAYGTRDNKEITLDGRLQLDMIQVIQRDHKLRSFSLNSVCAHFLGEQKEDVPHTIITDLQNGDAQTRRRLAVYCLKDAYLPQRLLDKLMVVINYMEMARVTGVPFNFLLTRGQQIKVVSQLYRKAIDIGLVIPALKSESSDEQYEGATVIEPKKAYYRDPIATLDFSSLYPSIMMAHNLCYSSLIMNDRVIELLHLKKDEDYIVTPSGIHGNYR